MVNIINKARQAARKAYEAVYYEGLCTVTEHKVVTDDATKISGHKEVVVLENQPCRLSFEKITSTNQTDTAAIQTQGVKLFLAPEIVIQPGSKITVTQNSVTADYTRSGVPAIYPTHQEITLELFKGWA